MKTLAQSRRLEERLRNLLKRWRERADQFAEHHCDAPAAVYRLLAGEIDGELRAWGIEVLSIQDAAVETGFSEEHLRRLARVGKIQSERGRGAKSHLRVRRDSLPAKTERVPSGPVEPVSVYNPDEDARDIAKRLGGSNA